MPSLLDICSRGSVEEVRAALASGKDVNGQNANKQTALMGVTAISCGHVNILKLLLEQPSIDLNLSDNQGRTALMHATHFGNIEAMKLLLANPSIEVNLEDEKGRTALHYATVEKNIAAVKLLLNDQRSII